MGMPDDPDAHEAHFAVLRVTQRSKAHDGTFRDACRYIASFGL